MRYSFMILLGLLLFSTCAQKKQMVETDSDKEEEMSIAQEAEVTKVEVQGSSGQYTFTVTVKSPDTGCDQYADWWEVLSLDRTLHYRRVLLHSHVTEQPFTRSGGPVAISPADQVYVRAHMNNTGYGSMVMKGSPEAGFTPIEIDSDFALHLAQEEPLPVDCDF